MNVIYIVHKNIQQIILCKAQVAGSSGAWSSDFILAVTEGDVTAAAFLFCQETAASFVSAPNQACLRH